MYLKIFIFFNIMNEQDWVTIPLTKKKPASKPSIPKPSIPKPSPLKHKKVSLNFSIALQQARQKRKWGRKDLAAQLNERESVIRDYENGTAIPSNQLIARMERVLNTHLRGPKIGQEVKHTKIEM